MIFPIRYDQMSLYHIDQMMAHIVWSISNLGNVKNQRLGGVPHKYRPYVWMTVTNAQTRMNNSIGLYKNLLTKGLVIKSLETVTTSKDDPSDETWPYPQF